MKTPEDWKDAYYEQQALHTEATGILSAEASDLRVTLAQSEVYAEGLKAKAESVVRAWYEKTPGSPVLDAAISHLEDFLAERASHTRLDACPECGGAGIIEAGKRIGESCHVCNGTGSASHSQRGGIDIGPMTIGGVTVSGFIVEQPAESLGQGGAPVEPGCGCPVGKPCKARNDCARHDFFRKASGETLDQGRTFGERQRCEHGVLLAYECEACKPHLEGRVDG